MAEQPWFTLLSLPSRLFVKGGEQKKLAGNHSWEPPPCWPTNQSEPRKKCHLASRGAVPSMASVLTLERLGVDKDVLSRNFLLSKDGSIHLIELCSRLWVDFTLAPIPREPRIDSIQYQKGRTCANCWGYRTGLQERLASRQPSRPWVQGSSTVPLVANWSPGRRSLD